MKQTGVRPVDIILSLEDSENLEKQKRGISRKLKIPPAAINEWRLIKHSIDARKAEIKIQLRLEVALGDSSLPPEAEYNYSLPPISSDAKSVIIVGCGPAGIFAALTCLQQGVKPIIIERGKDASARRFDLAPILRQGTVIEDSNYCFGEGGAGTFSDGKLYTRATKRGIVRDVYETLVAHGAPSQILTDAHPHVGSNLLPNVVKAMRETILQAGGEVHFQSKVCDFILTGKDGDAERSICGVTLTDGREIKGSSVILATGHSARDIYQLLHDRKILLEQKAFAVGFRIEHPQPLIDGIQYHYDTQQKRHDLLPAARYRLATKVKNRGVHSFCMCPGGFIVPAATENDEVVVNGMSLARRDSPFANSGLVVTIEPEDTEPWQKEHGVLAGIAFQRHLETTAKKEGGGGQVAPAQRLTDYLAGKMSQTLPKTSYFPGCKPTRLDTLLPDAHTARIQKGLKLFGQQMKGYETEEALLIGFETRTSSPVRIPRDETTLMHPEVTGLFPCAEGAGYAGGIVSAAMDGVKCALSAVEKFNT